MEWMIFLNLFLKFKNTKINQENIRNKVKNIFLERLFSVLNFNKRTILKAPAVSDRNGGGKLLFLVVVGPVKEGDDVASSADFIRRKGTLATIAFCNALFHGPVHSLGIGGVSGYIGEAAGLGGGLVESLPDVADSGCAGTRRIAVKVVINHALLPRPANGLVHVCGGRFTLASHRTIQEGQDLSLGAILGGGELGGAGAVGDSLVYGPGHGVGVPCIGRDIRKNLIIGWSRRGYSLGNSGDSIEKNFFIIFGVTSV